MWVIDTPQPLKLLTQGVPLVVPPLPLGGVGGSDLCPSPVVFTPFLGDIHENLDQFLGSDCKEMQFIYCILIYFVLVTSSKNNIKLDLFFPTDKDGFL